jgi:hypothetical protein
MCPTIKERCFLWSASCALLRNRAVIIYTAVNQHETIEEAVFFVAADAKLYNEELRQLGLEFSRDPELAVAAEN